MHKLTSKRSLAVYNTLDAGCKRVIDRALHYVDFSLIGGVRPIAEQEKTYAIGRTVDVGKPVVTNAKPGESTHTPNELGLSIAWDAIPCPFKGWDDREAFAYLAAIFIMCGEIEGVPIRWGNDWDRDGKMVSRDPDESFEDRPHYERVV